MLFIILMMIVCALIWWFLIRDEDNPLDKVPGPSRAPIIGNALQIMTIHPDDFFKEMIKYANEHGERFVLKIFNLRLLHISNPDDIEVVLSHTKNITKGIPYYFLRPWLGTGLLTAGGSKWQKRRKILTPAFHFNILKIFYDIMEEKSGNLVSELRKYEGQDVDLVQIISNFSLCIICDTAMGTQIDIDKSAASAEYKDSIMVIGHILMKRLTTFYLQNDFIFKMTTFGRQFKKSLKIVDDFAENVIKERRQNYIMNNKTQIFEDDGSKRRLAMLDLLLEAESKGDIDNEGIREEVNTFMFEGHDTIAMGLTFCLMILADRRDVQERIYEECKQLFKSCDGKPGMSDLSQLKYMEAVIKESLRLYPSVPMVTRMVDEDFMMRDLLVKKGTELRLFFYKLHRREDLFPDPEEFKPERFLDGDIKHPYAFLPFSAGLRNCIGQKFAMLEMKCALYKIICNFKMEPKIRGWRTPLLLSIVMRPVEPVYVKFLPRTPLILEEH